MGHNQRYNIFISYRRDGGEYTAKILCDSLREMGYRVFFDVETLQNGPFNTKLYTAIDSCTDFVLVLSPHALDRCCNEDDWVRREVEYALLKKKNIVPVILRGFSFPDTLPQSIEQIRFQNGIEANSEFFDAFLEKLQKFLISKPPFLRSQLFRKIAPLLFVLLVVLASFTGGVLSNIPETGQQSSAPPQMQDAPAPGPDPSSDPEDTASPDAEPSSLEIHGGWGTGSIRYSAIDARTAHVELEDNCLPDSYTISEIPGDREPNWNFLLIFDSNTSDLFNVTLQENLTTGKLSIFCVYNYQNISYEYHDAVTWRQEENTFIFDITLPEDVPWTTYDVAKLSVNLGTNVPTYVDHYEYWPE